VRPTFAALAFLRWTAAPGRLTPTADCLAMLGQELRPLKRAEPSLLPEVRRARSQVWKYIPGHRKYRCCRRRSTDLSDVNMRRAGWMQGGLLGITS